MLGQAVHLSVRVGRVAVGLTIDAVAGVASVLRGMLDYDAERGPNEPSIASEGPALASEGPALASDRPAFASEGPPLASDRPAPRPVAPQTSPGPVEAMTLTPAPDPAHIESESELVAERADPGAADGAGAELTVEEPWSGYSAMNAADIIDRVPTLSDAELAVSQLYEATHRQRRTVLAALDSRLKSQRPRPSSGDH